MQRDQQKFDQVCDQYVQTNEQTTGYCMKQNVVRTQSINQSLFFTTTAANVMFLGVTQMSNLNVSVTFNQTTSFFLAQNQILIITGCNISMIIPQQQQYSIVSLLNATQNLTCSQINFTLSVSQGVQIASLAQMLQAGGVINCVNSSITAAVNSTSCGGIVYFIDIGSILNISNLTGNFQLNVTNMSGSIAYYSSANSSIIINKSQLHGNITVSQGSQSVGSLVGVYSGKNISITNSVICITSLNQNVILQYCGSGRCQFSSFFYFTNCNTICQSVQQQEIVLFQSQTVEELQVILNSGQFNNTVLTLDSLLLYSGVETSVFGLSYKQFISICFKTSIQLQMISQASSLYLISNLLSSCIIQNISVNLSLNISNANLTLSSKNCVNVSASNIFLNVSLVMQGGSVQMFSNQNGNLSITNASCNLSGQLSSSSVVYTLANQIQNHSISNLLNYSVVGIANQNLYLLGKAQNSTVSYQQSNFSIQYSLPIIPTQIIGILGSYSQTNLSINSSIISVSINDLSQNGNFTVLTTDVLALLNTTFIVNATNSSNYLQILGTAQNISISSSSINIMTLAQQVFYGLAWNLTQGLNVSNSNISINSSLSSTSAGLVYQSSNANITIYNANCIFNLSNGNSTSYLGSVISQAQNVTININSSNLTGSLTGNNSSLIGGLVGSQTNITILIQNSTYCFIGNVSSENCAQACSVTSTNSFVCPQSNCSASQMQISQINLLSLVNISGLYTGFNNTNANFLSNINVSNVSITNNTTFSIFGWQQSFFAVSIVGALSNGLTFTGFLVTKLQIVVQYQCVQIQLVVNIANSSVLYFFQLNMQNSTLQNILLNCNFGVNSSGRFIGVENHTGGNSSIVNLTTAGNYSTLQNNCSLVFNVISSSANVSIINCSLSSVYNVSTNLSSQSVISQVNSTVFVNNTNIQLNGTFSTNTNSTPSYFGQNIQNNSFVYYQNNSIICFMAVIGCNYVEYIEFLNSSTALFSSVNVSLYVNFSSANATAQGFIYAAFNSCTSFINGKMTNNFSIPLTTAKNNQTCICYTNNSNLVICNSQIYMLVNQSFSFCGLIGNTFYNTTTISNISISGFMNTSNNSYGQYGQISGFVQYLSLNIINTTSQMNLTSNAEYVGCTVGDAHYSILIVNSYALFSNIIFQYYYDSGIIFGRIGNPSSTTINSSLINSNITIINGTYGVAIILGCVWGNTNISANQLQAQLNVLQNDGNLSAIVGYVASGYTLYYNLSNYNITTQLPCIKYNQGTLNASSVKGTTNCI